MVKQAQQYYGGYYVFLETVEKSWHLTNYSQTIIVSVAYPELVSRGVSKSRKFMWLVKVGACKSSNLKKNHGRGGGVSGQPENPPGYATVYAVIENVLTFSITVWFGRNCYKEKAQLETLVRCASKIIWAYVANH